MSTEAPTINRQPDQFLARVMALRNPGEEEKVKHFFEAAALFRASNPEQWIEEKVYRSRKTGQLQFRMKVLLQEGQSRKEAEARAREVVSPIFGDEFKFIGSRSSGYIGGKMHVDNPNRWVQTFGDSKLDDPMYLIKNPLTGLGEEATLYHKPGQFAAHLKWLGDPQHQSEFNHFRLGLHDYQMLNPGKWVEGKAYLAKNGELKFQVKVYLENGQNSKEEKAKLAEIFDQFMPLGRERFKLIGSRVSGFLAGELDIDTSRRWVKTSGDPNYFIKPEQEELKEPTVLVEPEPGLVRAARSVVASQEAIISSMEAHKKAINRVGTGVAAALLVGGVVWGLSRTTPVFKVNAASDSHHVDKSSEGILGLSATPSQAPLEAPKIVAELENPTSHASANIPIEQPTQVATQTAIPAPKATEIAIKAPAVLEASPLDNALNEFLEQEIDISQAGDTIYKKMTVPQYELNDAWKGPFIKEYWRLLAEKNGYDPNLVKVGNKLKPKEMLAGNDKANLRKAFEVQEREKAFTLPVR